MQAPHPPNSTDPARRQLTHLPTLDGIRGVAILMVLMHNFGLLIAPSNSVAYLIQLGMDIGWVGVELFFVLSGYLITRILLDTKDSSSYFSAFYMRRVLRIFPMYYGTLLVLLVGRQLLGGGAETQGTWAYDSSIWYWLFVSNWVNPFADSPGPFPHFWSLAVEEQYYLLWPLIVRANSSQRIVAICIVLIVASLGVRFWLLEFGFNEEAVYSFSICRMDALAMGALIAAAERSQHLWRFVSGLSPWTPLLWAVLLFLVGVLLIQGVYPRTKYETQIIGYTLLAIVFGLFVLSAVLAERYSDSRRPSVLAGMLAFTPLRVMGKYSYGIYVIHKPLYDVLFVPWLTKNGLLTATSLWVALVLMFGMIGICFVLEWLVYQTYEKRFLALKSRF